MRKAMKVLTAKQAWDVLANEAGSVLVDVRTPVEWAEIGLPDSSALPRLVVCLTWQPGLEQVFLEGLLEAVPDQNSRVLFLCRSGMRSHNAALLAEHAGYADVTNIVDGFEDKHGPGTGWRAGGLPFTHRPLSGS